MHIRSILSAALLCVTIHLCVAQEKSDSKPAALGALKKLVGVWDAEIEVWPQGPDDASIKFKGVETNRAYGEYWIASDFDSEFMDQTMRVHSIIGFDLDQRRMVGKVIDHGPYAASMTGNYDEESSTLTWDTKVKSPSGEPIVQKTVITQKSDRERILVLSVPGSDDNTFTKFMQIRFVKRDE